MAVCGFWVWLGLSAALAAGALAAPGEALPTVEPDGASSEPSISADGRYVRVFLGCL